MVVTIAYSATGTFVIAWAVQKTVGLRAAEDDELMGLDEAEHAETAYDHGRLGPHLSALHSSVPHRETPQRPSASKPPGSPGSEPRGAV